jgi:hypothetical protein
MMTFPQERHRALALVRQLAEAENLPFIAQGAEKGIGRKILETSGAASNLVRHLGARGSQPDNLAINLQSICEGISF